ncbi:retrovirus-related pol polyprotein from transposon TNT 1-94, partial [Tanacetum coccineum]
MDTAARTDTVAEGTTEGTKQNKNKSKSWKIGEIKYRQNSTCWNCNQKGHFQNQCLKLVASSVRRLTWQPETLMKHWFKLRSSKVRLADGKTLDIAGIGDVVLKTYFGTSWTLKDVTYFLGLKRSLVVARGNKRESLYMVEVHPEGISAITDSSGSQQDWYEQVEESFLHNVSEDKEIAEVEASSYR